MAEKIKEDKMILEREYTVPLRKKWFLAQRYKRTPKAIVALRKFVERNMKVYDNGIVKIDKYLNQEIWSRSIRKPPAKIKVKCKKFESGIVTVELAEMPQIVKWRKSKDEKTQQVIVKRKEEKKAEEAKTTEKAETEEAKEEKAEEKEKGKAEVEAGLKQQDQQARELKHVVKNTQKGMKIKKNAIQRMALQK